HPAVFEGEGAESHREVGGAACWRAIICCEPSSTSRAAGTPSLRPRRRTSTKGGPREPPDVPCATSGGRYTVVAVRKTQMTPCLQARSSWGARATCKASSAQFGNGVLIIARA